MPQVNFRAQAHIAASLHRSRERRNIMTTVFGPVTDWATDFDHGDPEYNKNIHAIWENLKASGCPIAHTDRYGGTMKAISPSSRGTSPPSAMAR